MSFNKWHENGNLYILYSQQKQAELLRLNPHTNHGRGSIFTNIHFTPLFIRHILVAYKWHFIVNKMIYVTEVCSHQIIRYMIALQSSYMIALQSPLSLHNWSRDRWQFIDVQRSRFLELKVNNPSTTPNFPPRFILAIYVWFHVNIF